MNIELKPIAESKVRQLGGDVCGVLVRKDQKLAAVDEHGRTIWLGDEALFDSIKQRADAWLGLVELLNDLTTEWRQHPGTGRESALAAIRGLAQAASAQGGQAADVAACPLCEYERGHQIGCENNPVDRNLRSSAQPQPAVPEGFALIPLRGGRPEITNDMKAKCMGEFSWEEYAPYNDEDGDFHDYTATHTVPWDLCKEIYKAMARCALLSTPTTPLADGWMPAHGMSDELPEIGKPVLGYHPDWVDADFCADGIRECFLFGDGSEWQSARWDGYSDQWIVEDGAPQFWQEHPQPPAGQEGDTQ